jgi:hypothetical protein
VLVQSPQNFDNKRPATRFTLKNNRLTIFLTHYYTSVLQFNMISYLQPMEVYVDDEAKLTLHGLQQYYVKLKENEKNKQLFELLDLLEFNQVCCCYDFDFN